MTVIDPAISLELNLLSKTRSLHEATARGDSDIQQFYNGSSVFVTGGTGFLGKQLIEKLFRSCQIRKLFVLIRNKKGKDIHERLTQTLKDPVFDVLRKAQPDFENRIIPVNGDIAELSVGMSDDDWNALVEEVDIICHVAATVRFDEPMKSAALTNVRGTREMLTFGKACKNLKSYIHVSTSYSHATYTRIGGEVQEKFYSVPVLPETLVRIAENDGDFDDITPLRKDWPNNYSFTKALSEDLVRRMGADLPICIVRPSIVMGAYREPLPGWLDVSQVYGPSGVVLGFYLGVMHTIYIKQDIKTDFTPVDYVNNAIIAAGWETPRTIANGVKDIQIYNITTNSQERKDYLTMRKTVNVLVNEGRNYMSPKSIWYGFALMTSNYYLYSLLAVLLHFIPACIADGVSAIFGKKPRLLKLYNKMYSLINVTSYYGNNEWTIRDDNTRSLIKKMSKTDLQIFNFDVKDINFTEFVLTWVLGFRRYIIKDELQNTDKAIRKQHIFKFLTFIIMSLYIFVAWKIVALFLRLVF